MSENLRGCDCCCSLNFNTSAQQVSTDYKWPSLICCCYRQWRLSYRRWYLVTEATSWPSRVPPECSAWPVWVITVPASLLQSGSTSQWERSSVRWARLELKWRSSVLMSSILGCLMESSLGIIAHDCLPCLVIYRNEKSKYECMYVQCFLKSPSILS